MPEFVIERDVPNAWALSDEALKALSLKSLDVVRELGPGIQWLHSYVCDDKVYCVYLSPDESLIQQHARTLGLPANRVSRVRRMLAPEADAADPVKQPRG